MFTDELRAEVWEDICQRDVRALAGKITPAVLAEAAKRTGVVLVKSPLCLGNLVWLGIACALHMSLDFACILTMTVKLLEDQQAFYSSELGKARRNGQRQERGKAGKTGKGKHGKSKHCPCIFLGRKPGNAIDYRQLDFLPLQDHPLRHRPGVRTVVCEPGFPIA
ncbi:MAG: hypothetical protein ACOX1P_17080 [Thermoguttaceae bacterium]|jgi:hypothetical protein